MSLLYCLVLVLFFGQMEGGFKEKPERNAVPLNVYKCDNFDPVLDPTVTLRETDDNGGKAVDLTADLKDKITGDFIVTVNVDKYSNAAWQHFYNVEDTLCAVVNKFIPKNWKRIRQEITPSIEEDCDVQPGHYELNGFTIPSSECEIPVSFAGKFRVEYKLATDEGEDYMCGMVEVEIS